MMVPIMVKVAMGAIASTISFSCLRNCLQTMDVIADERMEDSAALGLSIQDRLSQTALQTTTTPTRTTTTSSQGVEEDRSSNVVFDDCKVSILAEMKSLSRKESLCLFLSCPSISISDVEGEWNGFFLDNNGWIMTQIPTFITNTLFVGGRRGLQWNGKVFDASTGRGINRFLTKKKETKEHDEMKKEGDVPHIYQNEFAFAHAPSRLLRFERPDESALTGSSCVVLDYSPHQPWLSLWKSMRDEIRMVPLPSLLLSSSSSKEGGGGGELQLLIGLGAMAWSGGVRNSAPFCLWRQHNTTTATAS